MQGTITRKMLSQIEGMADIRPRQQDLPATSHLLSEDEFLSLTGLARESLDELVQLEWLSCVKTREAVLFQIRRGAPSAQPSLIVVNPDIFLAQAAGQKQELGRSSPLFCCQKNWAANRTDNNRTNISCPVWTSFSSCLFLLVQEDGG